MLSSAKLFIFFCEALYAAPFACCCPTLGPPAEPIPKRSHGIPH